MNQPPPNPSGVNPLHSRLFQSHAAAAAAKPIWRASGRRLLRSLPLITYNVSLVTSWHSAANATDANAASRAISPHRMAATTVAKHLSGRKMGLSAPITPVFCLP